MNVEAWVLEASDLEEVASLPGIVKAEKTIRLSAEIAALVKKVHVDVGSRVKPGQILIEFDEIVDSVGLTMFDVDATGSSGLGSHIDVITAQSSLDQILWSDPDAVTGNGSEAWTWDGNATVTAFENADQTGGNRPPEPSTGTSRAR